MIEIKIIDSIKKLFAKDVDDKITCAGCKCGQAECLENRDKYCPQSGFKYREEGD